VQATQGIVDGEDAINRSIGTAVAYADGDNPFQPVIVRRAFVSKLTVFETLADACAGSEPGLSRVNNATVTPRHQIVRRVAETLARADPPRRHAAEQPIPHDPSVKQNSSKMGDDREE
jgi:hypothetical protein